jgi:hypothetical protein
MEITQCKIIDQTLFFFLCKCQVQIVIWLDAGAKLLADIVVDALPIRAVQLITVGSMIQWGFKRCNP